MSLEVDGVWKANAWAPTVWVLGVWAEGGVVEEEEGDIPGDLRKSTPPRDLSPLVKWLKKEKGLEAKSLKEILDQVEKVIDQGLMSNAEVLDERNKREVLALVYIILALDF